MKRPKQIPAATRRIVETRCGSLCEGCGRRPATDVHHRKYKSRGGGHEIENLLALCGGPSGMPGGNHSGCHGVAHSGEGHELGWSCNTWETPAEKPVLYRGRLVFLTPTGGLEPVKETG